MIHVVSVDVELLSGRRRPESSVVCILLLLLSLVDPKVQLDVAGLVPADSFSGRQTCDFSLQGRSGGRKERRRVV